MLMDLQFTGLNSIYPHLNNSTTTYTCQMRYSFSLLRESAYL